MTCQKCKGHFPKVSCLKIVDGSEWELIGVSCLKIADGSEWELIGVDCLVYWIESVEYAIYCREILFG